MHLPQGAGARQHFHEARFLHHHVGAVFQLAGRQCPVRRSGRAAAHRRSTPSGKAPPWCPCSPCSTWCWRPFVGAFADATAQGAGHVHQQRHQGAGLPADAVWPHPLLAYAVVGLGAAAYSPAKYGILTELLPSSQLVKANGWIEGLTITSIILGVLLGGQLVGPVISGHLLALNVPGVDHRRPKPPLACWCSSTRWPSLFNLRIPRTSAPLGAVLPPRSPASKAAAATMPWPCCPISGAATPACGATSWANFAVHHHLVLGRIGQSALHRAGLGRRGAGL